MNMLRAHRRQIGIALLLAGLLLWLIWPQQLFPATPYSTVVESAEGELLGARVAADGQWRFPPGDAVPERFATALVQFEDRAFWYHPGINPAAIVRAAKDNLKNGRVVSGGSTITMQVIRLSRGKERTYAEKMAEAIAAVKLDLRCSKKQILKLYAAHAPFGGNVVGLEAAAWRYFGRPPEELSWAETATLAVLPNAPSSIHPGKNRTELLAKRNRLLKRLHEHGDIDRETYETSIEEMLPDEPVALPAWAPHYVEHCEVGKRTVTTISLPLQKAVKERIDRKSDELAAEGIADMAAVVMDNKRGVVLAYVGNASGNRKREGAEVDIAATPRSSGSILKPFLYAAALQEGTILPKTLLPDIPVNLGGFAPQNFDRKYNGAVHADEALARSLNIPYVFLLRAYGIAKFQSILQNCNINTLEKEASHYGLSLILGGGEVRLDEITAAYSDLAAGRSAITDEAARYWTFAALSEVNRPDELDWHAIPSVRKTAWKTGTSYGFRDAWAIGMTPDYTIGVWAGNADGHGVAGLTGARTAGPVLFDILNLLPKEENWFKEPADAQGAVWADVCGLSGHLAGPECSSSEKQVIPAAGLETAPCPYHHAGSFVLPPAMEWYYKPNHPEYEGTGKSRSTEKAMEFIYPASGATLHLPRQLSGEIEGAVFKIAHRKPNTTIWWHLDGTYINETSVIHELRLAPSAGKHVLTAVDADGETTSVSFTITLSE